MTPMCRSLGLGPLRDATQGTKVGFGKAVERPAKFGTGPLPTLLASSMNVGFAGSADASC